jgi:uncharacterized protein DUF3347
LKALLILYYSLKDALVDGDASTASTMANERLNAASNIDTKSLSSDDLKAFNSLALKLAFDRNSLPRPGCIYFSMGCSELNFAEINE